MALTYFRLLYVIVTNPGFVPRGPNWYEQQQQRQRRRRRSRRDENAQSEDEGRSRRKGHRRRSSATKTEKETRLGSSSSSLARGLPPFFDPGFGAYPYQPEGRARRRSKADSKDAMPDLSVFYNKEVYSCKGDGKPPWCSHCMQWKPDRAHHCSQIDRRVLKMDHFCPWYALPRSPATVKILIDCMFRVGGIVGETSFKFFIQFLSYTALFCTFLLVTMAIFVAEVVQKVSLGLPLDFSYRHHNLCMNVLDFRHFKKTSCCCWASALSSRAQEAVHVRRLFDHS